MHIRHNKPIRGSRCSRAIAGAAIASLLALVACATPAILNAPTGEYPCGIDGHQCLTPQGAANGFCCDNESVCGGQQPDTPITCPENSCCFVGSAADFDTALGMRKPTPQTKAK